MAAAKGSSKSSGGGSKASGGGSKASSSGGGSKASSSSGSPKAASSSSGRAPTLSIPTRPASTPSVSAAKRATAKTSQPSSQYKTAVQGVKQAITTVKGLTPGQVADPATYQATLSILQGTGKKGAQKAQQVQKDLNKALTKATLRGVTLGGQPVYQGLDPVVISDITSRIGSLEGSQLNQSSVNQLINDSLQKNNIAIGEEVRSGLDSFLQSLTSGAGENQPLFENRVTTDPPERPYPEYPEYPTYPPEMMGGGGGEAGALGDTLFEGTGYNPFDPALFTDLLGQLEASKMRQLEKQQQFITGERLGTQQFQTGERLGQEAFAKAERLGREAFQTSERLGTQEYGTKEREATQTYLTGERIGTQQFQTGERLGQEAFARGERIGTQEYETGVREQLQRFKDQEEARDYRQSQKGYRY